LLCVSRDEKNEERDRGSSLGKVNKGKRVVLAGLRLVSHFSN